MNPLLYSAVLVFSCGYALLRGRADERIAATVCIVGSLASVFVLSPLSVRYASVEVGELIVDMLVLALFVAVALRSERFWPLWISGLQLTTTLAHFLKAINVDLIPAAYGAAERFWSYPILILIAVGTWRQHRRGLAEGNPPHPA